MSPGTFAFFLAQVLAGYGQMLEMVVTYAVLPFPVTFAPTVFDGKDSVYILGGETTGYEWAPQIMKYSIETDSVQVIGTTATMDSYYGSAVLMGDGTLLYVGGMRPEDLSPHKEIWSSTTADPSNWTVVATLPSPLSRTSSVWDGNDNAFTLGGYESSQNPNRDNIYKYSGNAQKVEIVGQFPSSRSSFSSVWDNTTKSVYIFGGYDWDTGGFKDILRFDSVSGDFTTFTAELPFPLEQTCAVWTGTVAYIIGGNSRTNSDNVIVRFDPTKDETLTIPVSNFPSDLVLNGGCAFHEKLNRIYLFGGHSIFYTHRDAIMYVDLQPLSPTTARPSTSESTTEGEPTTTPVAPNYCENQHEKLIPNPFCCESFFQCDHNVAILHHCPDFLQFSPVTSQCEFPEIVRCGIHYE